MTKVVIFFQCIFFNVLLLVVVRAAFVGIEGFFDHIEKEGRKKTTLLQVNRTSFPRIV